MPEVAFSKSNLYGLTERQIIECIAQACISTVRPEFQKKYEGSALGTMLGGVHDIVMNTLVEKELSKEQLTELLELYNTELVNGKAKDFITYMENIK